VTTPWFSSIKGLSDIFAFHHLKATRNTQLDLFKRSRHMARRESRTASVSIMRACRTHSPRAAPARSRLPRHQPT